MIMDEKLNTKIQVLFRLYGCKTLEEQKNTLFGKCKEELLRLPDLERTLDETKDGWEHFIIQMAFENIKCNQ